MNDIINSKLEIQNWMDSKFEIQDWVHLTRILNFEPACGRQVLNFEPACGRQVLNLEL
jgi:hypothetical protein